MANMKRCKCGCREELSKRLARTFAAPRWGLGERMDFDSVADVLGCITGEDVATLCSAGLLEARGQSVALAEVLRFLEENGRWWFQLRLDKQLAELRADVNRREQGPDAVAYRRLHRALRDLRVAL